MADRVLPSRTIVNGGEFIDLPTYLQHVLLPLAIAWESGRLVDREAIDYEAAYQWASDNFVPQKFVDQCLDAALPDQDV